MHMFSKLITNEVFLSIAVSFFGAENSLYNWMKKSVLKSLLFVYRPCYLKTGSYLHTNQTGKQEGNKTVHIDKF